MTLIGSKTHYSQAWTNFLGTRFKYRTPRWYYTVDHNAKSLRRVGSFKTNQADWAKR